MKFGFWFSVSFVALVYAGYPAWLYVRARIRKRAVIQAPITPEVSVVLAVRNGAKHLPAKLRNLAELDYPKDRIEVIVVSDGSTDDTNLILAGCADNRLRALVLPDHHGKAEAVNRALDAARGEVIFFTDVRQTISGDALRHMVSNFADPDVGCVSGELLFGKASEPGSSHGMGLYWKVEKRMRYWEAQADSSVGVTGAIYATRASLTPRIPDGTILDDVYVPMRVAQQGARVIFEPRATAWDEAPERAEREFRRKVRTLVGNYQILQIAPWLLTASNPLLFEFVCHKLLRLIVPFALIVAFLTSMFLNAPFYRAAFAVQVIGYLLAGLGGLRTRLGILSRLANVALTFVVLNAAAAVAFFYFISGKKEVWV
ncbi:MAG TPA: glycosyltransferase family 2 protein [Terriglobales bacterium]|nr:glycosyltransferase family 2 protein [Terriglobales bacterium]